MNPGRQRALGSALLGFAIAFGLVHWLLPARGELGGTGLLPEPEEDTVTRSETLEPARRPDQRPAPEGEPGRDASAPIEPAPTEPAATPEETRPDGLILYGRVLDPEGVPIDDAYVWLQTARGERVVESTDPQGRYTLGLLPLETRRVSAGKSDHHEHVVELQPPVEPGLRRQDFVVRPKQIVRVRLLTSTGEAAIPALYEAKVRLGDYNLVPVATRSDPGDTFIGVAGALNNPFGVGSWCDDGSLGKPDLGPEIYGTVTLDEDGPAWLSLVAAHQVVRKQPIEASTEEVTFTLDPEDLLALQCGVSARMVDAETGAPLAGWFCLEEDPAPVGKWTAVEEDGRLFVEGALPGVRYLLLKAPDRAEHLVKLELSRGETLELGDLFLHSPISLTGEVRNAAGEPIEAELRWGLLDPGTNQVAWVQQRGATSRPDGRFVIGDLEPGHWVVQVQGLPARAPRSHDPSQASLPVRVDATEGSVAGIELVLGATTVITFVVEGAGDPWPYVLVLDEAKLPANSSWLGRWNVETQVHLLPGVYELVFKRDGEELERRPLVVKSEPQRIEWSIP